ncbi:MAG: efflux RND transporter periplasmic adaptor subunit [Bacteroidetes bacterium]|nr:efflux RND transporter periplasmic adaptor subunit [Bacteroidota bacterium]
MKHVSLLSIAIILAGVVLFSGCGKGSSSETVVPQKNTELSVDVQKPESGSLTEVLSYSGSLSGEEESILRSKVSETVSDVTVAIGQQVKKGTVLVKFDLTTSSVQYDQARSNYELAQKTFERNANLLKVGAISQQLFDQTKTQMDVALANFDNVRNMVQIESPIDGTVTSLNVSAGDFVPAGTPVVTVSRISSLKTSISLNSTDASKVKVGSPVLISLTDNPAIKTEGRITEIARSADPATRTFEAKIRLSSTTNFSSGLYVNVEILNNTNEKALLVPVTALAVKLGKTALFVMQPDSIVSSVFVTTGYRNNDKVTILSGVTDKDVVVTSGTLLLKDGDKVNPVVKN